MLSANFKPSIRPPVVLMYIISCPSPFFGNLSFSASIIIPSLPKSTTIRVLYCCAASNKQHKFIQLSAKKNYIDRTRQRGGESKPTTLPLFDHNLRARGAPFPRSPHRCCCDDEMMTALWLLLFFPAPPFIHSVNAHSPSVPQTQKVLPLLPPTQPLLLLSQFMLVAFPLFFFPSYILQW